MMAYREIEIPLMKPQVLIDKAKARATERTIARQIERKPATTIAETTERMRVTESARTSATMSVKVTMTWVSMSLNLENRTQAH